MLALCNVELYPAKSVLTERLHFAHICAAMRVCGTCRFGRNTATTATDPVLTPGAALVLAFSSTQLHGLRGIIAQIENLSEERPLSMAAAYCCVCRRCTWLCRPDAEINEACLEFLHMWRTAEQVDTALALMHR